MSTSKIIILAMILAAGSLSFLSYQSSESMNSLDFMSKQSLSFEKSGTVKEVKKVSKRVAVLYVPVNEINREIIEGRWEAYNLIRKGLDYKQKLEVKLTLESTGVVFVEKKVNEQRQLASSTYIKNGSYYISFYNKKRIAIFQELKDEEGNSFFQILEARKLKRKKERKVIKPAMAASVSKTFEPKANFSLKDGRYRLERAVNFASEAKGARPILMGDRISGILEIVDGQVTELSYSISTKNGVKSSSFSDVGLTNVGSFSTGSYADSISGNLVGKASPYILKAVAGNIAGWNLRFVTEEEYEKSSARFSAQQERIEKAQSKGLTGQEARVEIQRNIAQERERLDQRGFEEVENNDSEEVLDVEEAKENVSKTGFSFSSAEAQPLVR